jgi:cytochrome c peroxidase
VAGGHRRSRARAPRVLVYPNDSEQMGTFSTAGRVDLTNPFFQDLGSNGRTSHQPESAWTITPSNVERRFRATARHRSDFHQ